MTLTDNQALAMLVKWRRRLGLPSMWRFTVLLNHSRAETPRKDRNIDGKVHVRHEYFLADFTFNVFNHTSLKDFEETVVHEMVHVVVAPLAAMAEVRGKKRWKKIVRHAEETAVSILSKALVAKTSGEVAMRERK